MAVTRRFNYRRWFLTCVPVVVTTLLFAKFVLYPVVFLADQEGNQRATGGHFFTTKAPRPLTPRTGHELREAMGVNTKEDGIATLSQPKCKSTRHVYAPRSTSCRADVSQAYVAFPDLPVLSCGECRWGKQWITDSRGYVCKSVVFDSTSQCCRLPPQTNKNQQGIIGDVHTGTDLENSDVIDQELDELEAQARAQQSHLHGPLSCATCSPEFQCCIEYEFCVSCCLNHLTHGKDGKHSDDTIDPKSLLLPIYDRKAMDDFDVCSIKCKTSSKSVVHQNAFRSPLKHCYGLKDPPLKPIIRSKAKTGS